MIFTPCCAPSILGIYAPIAPEGYRAIHELSNFMGSVHKAGFFITLSRVAYGEIRSRDDKADIMHLLDDLGIGHLAMRYLDQLSGGQKQLVGLAQSREAISMLDKDWKRFG